MVGTDFNKITTFYYDYMGEVVGCTIKKFKFDLTDIVKTETGYDLSKCFKYISFELANHQTLSFKKKKRYTNPLCNFCLYKTPNGCNTKNENDIVVGYNGKSNTLYRQNLEAATVFQVEPNFNQYFVANTILSDVMILYNHPHHLFGFRIDKPLLYRWKIDSHTN